MLATLNDMLPAMATQPRAIAHCNVWGYEDARAVVEAAEAMNCPVILGLNRLAVEHMGVEVLAGILRPIGKNARVPVCIHLDHGKDLETAVAAMEAGFTSVMYDGSQWPLEENIARTREVVAEARKRGLSVEGEVGSVPYSDMPGAAKNMKSDPQEVARFAAETGVVAVAISIGNVHRLETEKVDLEFDRLEAIQRETSTPLVLHGASGVRETDWSRLRASRIAKVNFGTTLRQAFMRELRHQIADQPTQLDRVRLFRPCMEKVRDEAWRIFLLLGHQAPVAATEGRG
ncbi:MAG: class II fructose-bisphosphate aldolase [Verrucomicrobiae bacterium]|nr:class II fructose-bisphosphate aldolase [Verrucomicrobiae bacterium]